MAEQSTENSETKNTKKKSEEATTPNAKKQLKLVDLKVVDLRNELENRSLDKNGVKVALVERLKKALEDDGHNPDEYLFDNAGDGGKQKAKIKIEENLNDIKEENLNDIKDENLNDIKEENESEEEEMQTDDAANENSDMGEVLQLSLDDKDNLDPKDGPETQGKTSDTEEQEPQKSDIKMEVEPKAPEEPVAPSPKAKVEQKKVVRKEEADNGQPKNIWITGLSSATRAADLKTIFGLQGKVVSVKIVTNARQVTGDKKYYGFVTMTKHTDAIKAVESLNGTELNGQKINLELTPHQPGTLLKRASTKAVVKKIKAIGDVPKASSTKKKDEVKESKQEDEGHEKEREDRYRRDRDHRSRERDYREYRGSSYRRPFGGGYRGRGRGGRGGFSFRDRPVESSFRRPFGRKPFFNNRMNYRPTMKPGFMSYRMREEKERMSRDRFREREIRESERRRAQEDFRHRLIERKHREEAIRLEREKMQLRVEREMLERERSEILKLEREKQRLERERLEREKEKLRRQTQMREAQKRPFPGPAGDGDPVWEKDKRPRHYDNRYPAYPSKPMMDGARPDYREPPPPQYRKFEVRPDHYGREGPSTSRPDFTKYGKEKMEPPMQRDHDERRVYKRNYFKEDAPSARPYAPREPERYPLPMDDRFKRKMHDTRSPRGRGGGGGGRRMSYY